MVLEGDVVIGEWSVASGRSHPWGEEAATLPRLKSPIVEAIATLPRLKSSIVEATTALLRLKLPQIYRPQSSHGPNTDRSAVPPFPRYCLHVVRKEKEKLPSLVPIATASAREGARGKSTVALHRKDFPLMPREKCLREKHCRILFLLESVSDLWAGSSKEHSIRKKPAEEHPVVKKPTEATEEEHPTPVVKKPVAAREKHPSPAGEEHPAPAVKKLAAAGEDHHAGEEHPSPAVKKLVDLAVNQPTEAVGKKQVEEHPAAIEERLAKQSATSGCSHPCSYGPSTDCSVAAPFPRCFPHAIRKEKKKLPSPAPIVVASTREGAQGKSTVVLHREDFT
ncbi:hypothetical protein B296_00000273 [Ensete ventricosum]|uniref:Uncharacterized protein n=1 Tax=Ensete ventricosum TaxID=4639 RepID=A0A426ZP53_ENSVE|nr:hypothetical protein B296_00000273 [Ensete ventricosum]